MNVFIRWNERALMLIPVMIKWSRGWICKAPSSIHFRWKGIVKLIPDLGISKVITMKKVNQENGKFILLSPPVATAIEAYNIY